LVEEGQILVMAGLLKVAEDYSRSVISRMPASRLMVSPREPSRGRSPTLRVRQNKRKRRPANASVTSIYDINFAAFASFADGFLVGTNYADPIEAEVGEHTDQNGQMAWLENYCRNHPLDTYIKALIELRKYLLK
jgi:hypothetical protein